MRVNFWKYVGFLGLCLAPGILLLCGGMLAHAIEKKPPVDIRVSFHVGGKSQIAVAYDGRMATQEEIFQIVDWMNTDERFLRLLADRTKVIPFPRPYDPSTAADTEDQDGPVPIIRNATPDEFEKNGQYGNPSGEINKARHAEDYKKNQPPKKPGVEPRSYKVQCGIDD